MREVVREKKVILDNVYGTSLTGRQMADENHRVIKWLAYGWEKDPPPPKTLHDRSYLVEIREKLKEKLKVSGDVLKINRVFTKFDVRQYTNQCEKLGFRSSIKRNYLESNTIIRRVRDRPKNV
jgi:hypothetical protein